MEIPSKLYLADITVNTEAVGVATNIILPDTVKYKRYIKQNPELIQQNKPEIEFSTTIFSPKLQKLVNTVCDINLSGRFKQSYEETFSKFAIRVLGKIMSKSTINTNSFIMQCRYYLLTINTEKAIELDLNRNVYHIHKS